MGLCPPHPHSPPEIQWGSPGSEACSPAVAAPSVSTAVAAEQGSVQTVLQGSSNQPHPLVGLHPLVGPHSLVQGCPRPHGRGDLVEGG